ncbi:MAG TPA: SEC59/DGK1/VTE5 family protein [Bdellovibrionota bacterium]|jgi:dolichol kinase|nr:SEC59/DGK1/VTE5 family protein [Bdellovibrionota bacterium]
MTDEKKSGGEGEASPEAEPSAETRERLDDIAHTASKTTPPVVLPPEPTRKSLQLSRRGFHMLNGVAGATAYAVLFSHQQAVYLLGTVACLIYLFEQIRINYPELMTRFPGAQRAFYRAEERFKESAMIPYAIAVLLTILTFPKALALIGIYTLAVADPISAIVGIRFGRHHIVKEKSVEGSLAFLAATFFIAMFVLWASSYAMFSSILGASLLIAIAGAAFEMLPIRLDDNLTIPIFVGFMGWLSCAIFGVPL